MSTSNNIEHSGEIKEIRNGQILVRILSVSACSSCHAKGACAAADMQEKEIEVVDNSGQFSVGERVSVNMQQSLGFKALLLGYVLPFVLVLFSLIILTSLSIDELISGLISLAILVPYYILLYYFKDHLKKTFSFSLRKLD